MNSADMEADEAIAEILKGHPGLLAVIRGEVDTVISSIRALWWAPMAYVYFRCERLGESLRAHTAVPDGTGWTPDAARLERDIAHYRILKDALAFFNALHQRCAKGPAGLRQMEQEFDREIAEHGRRAMCIPRAVASFDARAFVEELAARGVMLTRGRDGRLSATPSTKLTDADRTMIRLNHDLVADAMPALVERF